METLKDYIDGNIKQAKTKFKAPEILDIAMGTILSRAEERDVEEERSMAAAIKAFNALRGQELSEEDGWIFMVLLKISRSRAGTRVNIDDYVDGSAYMALAGECKSNEVA